MNLEEKFDKILARYAELGARMSEPSLSSDERVDLGKEYSDLTPVIEGIKELRGIRGEMGDLAELMVEPDSDADMRALAEEEFAALKGRQSDVERRVQVLLLPRDEADHKNVILEVRAGTGGEEAALFAANLFRMYHRFADHHGWRFEIMGMSETGIGGLKDAVAEIKGRGAYARVFVSK